jgi:hypothetical protein
MLYAGAYLLSLGTKWYELEDGREYTAIRLRAGLPQHPDFRQFRTAEALWDRYRLTVEGKNIEAAYWCLDEVFARKMKPLEFYTIAAPANSAPVSLSWTTFA